MYGIKISAVKLWNYFITFQERKPFYLCYGQSQEARYIDVQRRNISTWITIFDQSIHTYFISLHGHGLGDCANLDAYIEYFRHRLVGKVCIPYVSCFLTTLFINALPNLNLIKDNFFQSSFDNVFFDIKICKITFQKNYEM